MGFIYNHIIVIFMSKLIQYGVEFTNREVFRWFIEEIEYIKEEIAKIYRKYKEKFKKSLESLAKSKKGKEKEYAKKLLELMRNEEELLKRFIRSENIEAEVLLAEMTRILLKVFTMKEENKANATKSRVKTFEIIKKDREKIYELSKKIAIRTGNIPLTLVVIEAER